MNAARLNEHMAKNWRQQGYEKKAQELERRAAFRRKHGLEASGACPSFFRAHIAQAPTARRGYFEAGYHLALHMRSLVQGDVPDKTVRALDRLIEKAGVAGLDPIPIDEAMADDDLAAPLDAIWHWMTKTLPRCMALVPRARKRTFMAGVLQTMQENGI